MPIMIIRHAEKPSEDASVEGVDATGRANSQELSVRGWQRAGALVGFFTGGRAQRVEAPQFLFAPRPTPQAPSVRALHTLVPLADFMGRTISTQFAKGEEAALVAGLTTLPGPVLVAWEHKAIVDIANALMGGAGGLPQSWPDDRFDLVWVFEKSATETAWRFHQVPQLLLAGDSARPI